MIDCEIEISMEKKQEEKIISFRWVWAMPKKPSCLLDKAIVNIAKNPELALKQNIVENNYYFWRKAYELQRTRR